MAPETGRPLDASETRPVSVRSPGGVAVAVTVHYSATSRSGFARRLATVSTCDSPQPGAVTRSVTSRQAFRYWAGRSKVYLPFKPVSAEKVRGRQVTTLTLAPAMGCPLTASYTRPRMIRSPAGVGVAVLVAVRVAVELGRAVGVQVSVAVAVDVRVLVRVSVGVLVRVAVVVGVEVPVAVDVPVAV